MIGVGEIAGRPARIGRRLRAAAAAHRAGPIAVSRRAAHLVLRRGWALEEADRLGLLDPRIPPERLAGSLSEREAFALQDRLNPWPLTALAHDKALFAEWLRFHRIPTPATIAVNARPGPGWLADGTLLHGEAQWVTLLDGLRRDVVLKPARGHKGFDVRVLRPGDGGFRHGDGLVWTSRQVVAAMAESRWDGFLLQERSLPHPEIAALSGSDVLQTVRMVTLVEGPGAREPRLIMAYQRLATRAGDVDNYRSGASGNLFAAVALSDGRLGSGLVPHPGGRGSAELSRHPATGAPIPGFVVPDWPAAVDLALRAARAALPLHTVGWDIAPTTDGPVVIEANPQWSPNNSHPDHAAVTQTLREAASAMARASGRSGGRRSRWSIR